MIFRANDVIIELYKKEDKKGGYKMDKRDVQKEYERQKEINKRYVVKVPLYMAKVLDEKLKKERKNLFKHST